MIAFNDKEYKIAYLEFYDRDIDFISEKGTDSESMKSFVGSYFKYNFE